MIVDKPTVDIQLSVVAVQLAFEAHMRQTGSAPTTLICSAANFDRAIEVRHLMKFEWLTIQVVHAVPMDWWAVCSPMMVYYSGF